MYEEILKDMILAAQKAKDIIINYYKQGVSYELKEDNSPVTIADKESNKCIKEYLTKKYPGFAILSEEDKDSEDRLKNDYVIIIDPLDGTEDFIKRTDQFAINIALCYKHEIVAGVIGVPCLNYIYYASKDNGSYKIDENGNITKLHVSNKTDNLTCLVSMFHTTKKEEELISKHKDKIGEIKKCGSSYKACMIAEGKAEFTYRMSSGTKEWDTAPFEIIIKEAGGVVLKPDLTPMKYNRKDVYNREGYIVANKIENILL